MARDWTAFFPHPTPRPEQIKTLDAIADAYEAGHTHFIAALPTGTGKSAIALAFARWFDSRTAGGAHILTSQRILQDQYAKEFTGAVSDMRSSGNFTCNGKPDHTCGQVSRLRQSLPKVGWVKGISCKVCPYQVKKEEYINNPIGCTNYSFFLSERVYAGKLPLRGLMICDEAHNVEDEVRRWATVSINRKFAVGKLKLDWPTEADLPAWILDVYRPAVMKYYEKLVLKVKKTGEGPHQANMPSLVAELDFMDKHRCQLNRMDLVDVSYVYTYGFDEASAIPLDVTVEISENLWKGTSFVLLMTATALDRRLFIQSTAVPDTTPYFELPSPFEAWRYGITYTATARMSGGGIKLHGDKIKRAIKEILRLHPNDKGIIHANSYEITRVIEELRDPRLLIQKTGADREGMLERHKMSSQPTVLVSPGMTEGVDLRGDMGRFQVIAKIPYPYFGDPVVSAHVKSDREWYAWQTIMTLVQAVGRCVRNKEDWAKTYILDQCFVDLLNQHPKFFPEYFEHLEVINL